VDVESENTKPSIDRAGTGASVTVSNEKHCFWNDGQSVVPLGDVSIAAKFSE
jgi:hypothetical protein